MKIRRGEERDIPQLEKLLYQVHKGHADARADIFVPGAKKYTREELTTILADDGHPVYVAEEDGIVLGYAFCIFQQPHGENMYPRKSLYIDDLCVDQSCRGGGVGAKLYHYVTETAKAAGCYSVTLNVWACNPSAFRFYQRLGLEIQKYGMEKILE